MVEPQKPFACTMPECGMTFTNEDHLHVHKKKHDMVLQLGLEQKAAFVADQTPTPTRFIRNCEEVGLFQDLQNVTVNPFDEGFKRAMETKHGILSLEGAIVASGSDDVLHTPQMVFPLIDPGDSALFSVPAGSQRHITISRSSSDESGTIKEYETTTISKLTNEVTTISRIVGNRDLLDKLSADDVKNNDTVQNRDIETVSYKNNVIKICSNVEIRKDNVDVDNNKTPVLIYTDSVIKDTSSVVKDVLLTDTSKLQVPDKVPPIMSQKSLDFVVDSLTSELNHSETVVERDKEHSDNASKTNDICGKISEDDKVFSKIAVSIKKHSKPIHKTNVKTILNEQVKSKPNDCETNNKCVRRSNMEPNAITPDDYEVIIKLPNGKQVRMKSVEETKPDTKEILRNRLANKMRRHTKIVPVPNMNKAVMQNVLQIPTGTLIPVTLVNEAGAPINSTLTHMPVTNTVLTTIPVTNTIRNKVAIPISKNLTNLVKLPIIANMNGVISNAQRNISKTPITSKLPHKSNRIAKRRRDANFFPLSRVKVIQAYQKNNSRETQGNEVICLTDDENKSEQSCGLVDDSIEKPGSKEVGGIVEAAKRTKSEMESRCEASKRYRERLRESMREQREENKKLRELNRRLSEEGRQLREANQRLIAEKAVLKLLVTEHMRSCPQAEDLRITQERLRNTGAEFQT